MRSSAGVRRRCKDRLDGLAKRGLEIPRPFDAAELVARLGRCQDKVIELVAIIMPAGAPYGLTVFTESGEHIIAYEARTSRVHRDHIIVHEAAHIALGHRPIEIDNEESTRLILPHLAPALIRQVLNRMGAYTVVEEQEAETMATMLLRLAGRHSDPDSLAGLSDEDAAICDRLHQSFENPL